MSTTRTQLKKKIMRGVYYAFALRLGTHPVFVHMGVLVVAGYLLGRLVHVAAIYHNIMDIRVGELGQYILGTLMTADVATLVVCGVLVFTALSLQWRLLIPRWRHHQELQVV